MKEKLQNSFKSTPERFVYSVDQAVKEASSQAESSKKRLSRGWKTVIAIALIAALIPTTVFGASKLYGIIAKPVDNYGLELDLQRETDGDYPLQVKMHVEVPEGFAEVPNTDGLKYYSLSAKEPYTDGFSLEPMRFYRELDRKEYIGNVDSYEERVIDGHQAYEIKFVSHAWNRLYVYYEDVNVLLLIYNKDVTNAQLTDFVKGISFTEGTEGNFTYLSTPFDERPQDDDGVYEQHNELIEYPLDTKLSFTDEISDNEAENACYTAQLGNIRILDNISELDYSCFNDMYSPYEIADSYGWLEPKTIEAHKEGDGFKSVDEVISSDIKEQKLILADVTYTNLSDKDIELFIPYSMDVFEKDEEGGFKNAGSIDQENGIYSDPLCDDEITYLTPHGIGKSFYIPTLRANETLTVTVGFRCNSDVIDKAYLTMYNVSNVTEPAYDGSDAINAVYLFKVQ